MNTETSRNISASSTGERKLDMAAIKDDFPILKEQINGHRLVFLDSAASSQKPEQVIESISEYYRTSHANIHRGLYTLSERATDAYEKTRLHVASFINSTDSSEVIFTRGATESINIVASTIGEEIVSAGDEILITEMEHHANFVPWYQLAKRKSATLKTIPITSEGLLDVSSLEDLINERTKIVAFTHMSNVLGTINPVAKIAELAHGVGAIVVVDGAQAAPHLSVDVQKLQADFYAFSSHKMLGPTGVGVLWGKKSFLEEMPPFLFGGDMIKEVSLEKVTWNDLPNKFEAGTPNIADVVAFDAALSYLERLGMDLIRKHEIELTEYALNRLSNLKSIEIQGPLDPAIRGGAISFTDKDIHPHDISSFLDSKGIAIRAGHHCAQPLMRKLNKIATARASFYVYNDKDDIDILIEALKNMRSYFGL